jgi:hypothetical protein
MLDGRKSRLSRDRPEPLRYEPNAFDSFVDHEGHAWGIRIGPRLQRFIEYASSDHTAEIPFSTIFEDRERNLWLGTEGEGIFQLQR